MAARQMDLCRKAYTVRLLFMPQYGQAYRTCKRHCTVGRSITALLECCLQYHDSKRGCMPAMVNCTVVGNCPVSPLLLIALPATTCSRIVQSNNPDQV